MLSKSYLGEDHFKNGILINESFIGSKYKKVDGLYSELPSNLDSLNKPLQRTESCIAQDLVLLTCT